MKYRYLHFNTITPFFYENQRFTNCSLFSNQRQAQFKKHKNHGKAKPWITLFDGKNTDALRGYGSL